MQSFQQATQFVGGDQCDIPTVAASDDHGLAIIDHIIKKLLEVGACLRVCPFDCHDVLRQLYSSTVPYFAAPAHTSSRTGTSSFTVTSTLCGTLMPKSGMWILKL